MLGREFAWQTGFAYRAPRGSFDEAMTSIYHSAKRDSLKQEVHQIKKSAKKAASSKDAARKFLVSTGVYTRGGKLTAKFR